MLETGTTQSKCARLDMIETWLLGSCSFYILLALRKRTSMEEKRQGEKRNQAFWCCSSSDCLPKSPKDEYELYYHHGLITYNQEPLGQDMP